MKKLFEAFRKFSEETDEVLEEEVEIDPDEFKKEIEDTENGELDSPEEAENKSAEALGKSLKIKSNKMGLA